MHTLLIPFSGSDRMPKRAIKPTKPFVFGIPHDTILKRAIYPYHLVTTEQVIRLLYRKGTYTTAMTHLKAMRDNKYVQYSFLPTLRGNRPYLHFLGPAGKKALKAEGMDLVTYFEKAELDSLSYGWKMHVLELNDFLIAAATLSKSVPTITLVDWLHDFTIARNPPASLNTHGQVAEVHPDGFVHFTHTLTRDGRERTRHYRFLVELDRGSESEDKIRRKIRDYLTIFEHGGLHTQFNAYTAKGEQAPLIILFPTTTGAQRVAILRKYLRLELKAHKPDIKEDSWINRMFKVASVPPLLSEQPDPKSMFCAPFWTSPYAEPEDKTSLISL
jgi:hypothetical protein